MEHEERQLISGLFDRMRGFGTVQKDRDADQLIAQNVRAMPDAPYLLVQSVLIHMNVQSKTNPFIIGGDTTAMIERKVITHP